MSQAVIRGMATSAVKQTLLTAGVYDRMLRDVTFSGVAVLCYHNLRADGVPLDALPFGQLHLSASDFARHCEFLQQACHPISLDTLRAARLNGVALPPRPVLVTFDDGYRSTATIAKPILEAHRIPAVVFACTGPIASRTLFWFDAVARRDGEEAVERLKAAPVDEWRARVEERRVTADVDDPAAPLSVSELEALATSPLIEIGAHTVSHPILARASVSDQYEEIDRSRQALEAWLGRRVTAFAYPNGRPGVDYVAETVAAVGRLQFDVAFNTDSRVASERDPLLELPRLMMMTSVTAAELAHRLTYHVPRR